MSQSFFKKPDNGPHSALAGLGVLASEQRPYGCAAHGLAHPCEVCAAESQLEQMREDGNADDVTEAVAHLERVKHQYGVKTVDGGQG